MLLKNISFLKGDKGNVIRKFGEGLSVWDLGIIGILLSVYYFNVFYFF